MLRSYMSRQVQDTGSRQQRLERKFDWFDDNLYWYQLGDQSLTHQGLWFMLLVLWFGVFFIEKSSRESVEAISGLAVFDRFYQDSGRKSACVNDVQSPRAAYLVNRSHRKKIRYVMKLLYFLYVLLFFQNMKFCSRTTPAFLCAT